MISWLEKNKWIPQAITIALFIFVFYVSSLSFASTVTGPQSILATVYHLSVFFLLAVFFFISTLERKWEPRKILLALGIVLSYATLDELHQYFVPGRFCSFGDFLVDSTGIAFASLIYLILILKKKQ